MVWRTSRARGPVPTRVKVAPGTVCRSRAKARKRSKGSLFSSSDITASSLGRARSGAQRRGPQHRIPVGPAVDRVRVKAADEIRQIEHRHFLMDLPAPQPGKGAAVISKGAKITKRIARVHPERLAADDPGIYLGIAPQGT